MRPNGAPQNEPAPFSVWEHVYRDKEGKLMGQGKGTMWWIAGGFSSRYDAIDAVRGGQVQISEAPWSVHSCERINRIRQCPPQCECTKENE